MTPHPIRRNPQYAYREVAGEAIIVSPKDGAFLVLNPVGSLIWSLADGSRDFGAIVAAVVKAFDVDRARADADARTFLDDLRRKGMLEEPPVPAPRRKT
jgi:hypothetical protein